MEKLIQFKDERQNFGTRLASLPIEAERAQIEVNDRKIKGYAIIWGSKNDYNEIVLKGATLNSLNARGVGTNKNKIVLLNQHRQSQPLGHITVLREDDTGLYFEADIISGVGYADEAVEQIRQGVLSQLSYGFSYIWDKVEYDEERDAYILKEIKLYEISLVTFSSDENAQLRSLNDYQERSLLNSFTDEQINELKTLIEKREKKSRDEHSEENTEPIKTNNNIVTIF